MRIREFPVSAAALKTSSITQQEAEAFLYRVAELLDELRLEEWLRLFTPDGLYWVPIDESLSTDHTASIVRDDTLRREERVFHLLNTKFPAQSPRSRTLHMVSNVRIAETGPDLVKLHSNQTIHEVRTGDFRQVGLGIVNTLIAKVEHVLTGEQGDLKIALKKIVLINRDMPQGNLTFLF
jgi:3-phenylpropionate/cinnamic acid dioxygenase small subunit